MLSKKIIAASLALTMACSAAVTGLSVVDTGISADAVATLAAKATHVLKVNTENVNYKSVSDYRGKVHTWTNNSKDKITFKSSNKKIFTVESDGTVYFKNPGMAYLYVTAGASDKYDAVTKKVPIYVKPKKTENLDVDSLSKSDIGVKYKATWKRDPNVTGYIVKYSYKETNSHQLINPKRVVISSNKKNYFIHFRKWERLKNKKLHAEVHFQVCAYVKIGEKVLYGPMCNPWGYQ